jgi:hypothetical protein
MCARAPPGVLHPRGIRSTTAWGSLMDRSSIRWIAALGAILAILVFGLSGTAYAPSSAPVRIVDGTDPSKAAGVNPGGTLRMADESSRAAYAQEEAVGLPDGSRHAVLEFSIPLGKRLVITQISGQVGVPVGQQVGPVLLTGQLITLGTPGSHTVHQLFVPVFNSTFGTEDVFAFSQATQIYLDGSGFSIDAQRPDPTGDGSATIDISGYLIDCSAGCTADG